MNNLITGVPGLRVGHAHDERLGSGVTALIFEAPAIASIAVHGGAPGLRDAALLEPSMTIERVDALVLSGGSVYGLDSMGGVAAFLRESGRGYTVRDIKVPIVPGAILFDLLNGGDKSFGCEPVYWHLGYRAARGAAADFALGSAGAGYGATTADLKGGLGSASDATSGGFRVGALVAVNALGRATIGGRVAFLGRPLRKKWRVRRPRLARALASGRARLSHQGRRGGKYDHRHRRDRRGPDQTGGEASCHHGA